MISRPLFAIVLLCAWALWLNPAGGGRSPNAPPESVSVLCDPYKKEAYQHRVNRSIWSNESFLERIPQHDSIACGKTAN